MASTYSTNFGFEKIATGEQSGTWGTTTNFNMDILDRITAYKAVALSGTTHTLTVREASPGSGTENLQDGMYRAIKFTGALGGNNTVTIAPNTAATWFVFENATTDSGSSGPYSVILSQGSGANVTIQNGKNVIVYCDGTGSGAAVVNALSDLQIATLECTGTAAIDGALTAAGGIAATGNVTATGTVEPAGDTAAADNAAIGYTSTEGLILTGQGSTNDVTLKNDADAEVFGVPTGATGVTFKGVIRTDDATDSTSGTSGSIQTDGGIGAVKEIVTDATFQPLGDTAASDKAAVGYTSGEGLILTGQGSTNDVTIKNDADADVLKIATGGTGVEIVGGLTLGTDLSVANGGTGASTFTANNVLLGNGTSAFQTVAASTSGNVLTSNGSTWTSAAAGGGGKILQVVQQTVTTTATTSGGSWNDSGMTQAITPSASSSKILILVDANFGAVNYGFMRLVRGSTVIGVGTSVGSRNAVSSAGMASAINDLYTASKQSVTWLDSPSTTSSTTYKTQVVNNYHSANTITRNSGSNNANATYVGNSVCTITLLEIDGS